MSYRIFKTTLSAAVTETERTKSLGFVVDVWQRRVQFLALRISPSLNLVKNLKGRLMLALTLIALLSIVGFGLAAYMSERGALTEDLRADLTSAADSRKSQIIDWLNGCRADVKMLAINKSNRGNLSKLIGLEEALLPNQAQDRALPTDSRTLRMMTAMLTDNLLSLQQSRIGYDRIVIADRTGRIRITTDAKLLGQSVANDPAFRGAVNARQGAYIQDIHPDPKGHSGQYWMEFGYIINRDFSTNSTDPANTIGVVLITVNLNETLFPLLRSWRMGKSGAILLYNAQHNATIAIRPQSVTPTDSAIFAINHSASSQSDDGAYEATLETLDSQGTPIVAAYRRIVEAKSPNINWQFVVKMDLGEIYAPLYSLLAQVAWIAIMVLCITILASVLIARTLSRPLAELVRATQSVTSGNLKTKIDFTRDDEIGQLAKAFQEMIGAVDQRQRELEDANVAVHHVALENARLAFQLKSLNVALETKIMQRTHDLATANQRLQQLDAMKSAFLLNVSHELRNPVTSLKFNLDLLERELIRTNAQSLKSQRYIITLTKDLDLLARIIEDTLNMLYLEREKDNIILRTIDLNRVVETTLADYKPQLDAAALKLTYAPTSNLSLVKADSTWLAQMLTYLLNNAILYNTPGGHIHISTHFDGQGQVGFQIEDTGMGISAEEVEHIFERFYRGAMVNEMAIPGTGLGLSIVKEIVHLHRGQIEVESRLHQGSTFRVWLPVDESERRDARLFSDHNLVNGSIANQHMVFQKWPKSDAVPSEF